MLFSFINLNDLTILNYQYYVSKPKSRHKIIDSFNLLLGKLSPRLYAHIKSPFAVVDKSYHLTIGM